MIYSHIIYVNGAYKNDEDPIGRLVHDFGCVRSSDMYNDLLKEQVYYYFKETEGGRAEVCAIIEDAATRAADKMLAEKIKIVMIKMNDSAEKAMEFWDIPEEEWARYKALI